MADLEAYRLVPSGGQEVFLSSGFQNISEVRRYFNDSSREKLEEPRFDTIDDILSFYSQIASKYESDPSIVRRCKNPGKDIPVPLSELYSYCTNPDTKEAPYKLIVKIANDDTDIVRLLIGRIRKVLRRDRQLVPIDRLQQIDNSCIRWLARQPGYIAEEKAGTKQKLMGVVRYESADTLENRVFKQYLRYCLREGRDYIRRYQSQYPDSENCRKVARFVSFVSLGIESPAIQEARNLHSIPAPNYTLQNNRLYREIWKHYLLLARHISEIELIWKNRHEVFHELVRVLAHAVADHETHNTSSIVHEIWLSPFPGDNGRFVSSVCDYHDYDRESGSSIWLADSDGTLDLKRRAMRIVARKALDSYYVPQLDDSLSIYDQNDRKSRLVYLEGGMPDSDPCLDGMRFIAPSCGSNIVFDVFDAVRTWVRGGSIV